MDEEVRAVEQFAAHIKSSRTLPVLFVGSGISRRYLGLPDWRGLLSHFSATMGKPITYYEGKSQTGLPGVATEIARDLYELWWTDDVYADSRAQNEHLVQHFSDPLKIEISRYIEGFDSPSLPSELLAEMESLARVNAHAVLTTNWDHLLEKSFPSYHTFVGQESVLFAETQGIGEIYKIHGSMEEPSSLVLTHEDYVEYEARNPYLLAKVLTFFVENPIVFLGYSLTDSHIQELLGKLLDCISVANIERLNERLIFIRRPSSATPPGYRMAPMLLRGHNINVIECVADDFTPFFTVMAELPRRFPLKMLRQLKQEVYELAFTEPPAGRIHVLDIDDQTRLDDVDVVVGVGTRAALSEKGYVGFSRRDFTIAMLKREENHPAEKLIEHVLPVAFKSPIKWAPIFYPLYLYAVSHGGELRDTSDLPQRAQQLMEMADIPPYFPNSDSKGVPFVEYAKRSAPEILSFGLGCTFDSVEDVEALRLFLLDLFVNKPGLIDTSAYKLACKYDRLEYGAKLSDFNGEG
ncbi:hypothetical protein H4696_006142 [Amycolatopsis lexingtonensis]|uniref:SIR2-like domain-containing protein n=1 Tax=Amycolatopsis lexingtonensis TaxID=218822 RepID=A0ABR9I7U5_9PSEU|nr:SIR2 family protein [Amycolatopsis lexingtonensis]MBE1499042.1 hypothetical protein [Amycolatopsis lexingtonensis]